MKVFISQPMSGRMEEEILIQRNQMIEEFSKLEPKAYYLDSFIRGAKDVNPLFCLGHAISELSKADIAIFAPDWQSSRGCHIEFECCLFYNIPMCRACYIDDGSGISELRFISMEGRPAE